MAKRQARGFPEQAYALIIVCVVLLGLVSAGLLLLNQYSIHRIQDSFDDNRNRLAISEMQGSLYHLEDQITFSKSELSYENYQTVRAAVHALLEDAEVLNDSLGQTTTLEGLSFNRFLVRIVSSLSSFIERPISITAEQQMNLLERLEEIVYIWQRQLEFIQIAINTQVMTDMSQSLNAQSLIQYVMLLSVLFSFLCSGVLFWNYRRYAQKHLQQANNERQNALHALDKHHRLMQAIMDHSPSGIFVRDTQGRYLAMNKKALEIRQYTEDDVIGKTVFDIHGKEQAEIILADDHTVIERQETRQIEFRSSYDQRTRIATKFPIFAADATVYAVCTLTTDITEYKNVQEELEQYKKHLEVLIAERTEQLRSALGDLELTRGELLQAEKMATIGQLTAGITTYLFSTPRTRKIQGATT